MRVVLHADASHRSGTGHVMRCLALAAALRRDGAEVVLATDELIGDLAERAAALGVRVMSRAAAGDGDWVVVDGYHLDNDVGRGGPDAAPSLVVDDLGGAVPHAQLVLNQNLYAGPAGPTEAPDGELLAGPGYALLGEAYAAAVAEREPPPLAERVLITMGGSDPNNASAVAVEACRQLRPAAEVRLIIGGGHRSAEALARQATEAGATVVRNAPSLVEHLAWADLVVSACGSGVLEAVRLGRPIVGVVLADNQLLVASAVESQGLGRVAGRHPGLAPSVLRDAIARLRRDQVLRAAAAKLGPRLVDGKGAQRVARAMATGALVFRPASAADAAMLLDWRNDEHTRAMSFDTGTVSPEAHGAWLADRLASQAHRIWIGQLGAIPVGVVRFSLEERIATISVTVSGERRGAGLGARLIGGGCSRLAAERVADHVDAWIRPENDASIAAFMTAGFRPMEAQPDRVRYRLPLSPVR